MLHAMLTSIELIKRIMKKYESCISAGLNDTLRYKIEGSSKFFSGQESNVLVDGVSTYASLLGFYHISEQIWEWSESVGIREILKKFTQDTCRANDVPWHEAFEEIFQPLIKISPEEFWVIPYFISAFNGGRSLVKFTFPSPDSPIAFALITLGQKNPVDWDEFTSLLIK